MSNLGKASFECNLQSETSHDDTDPPILWSAHTLCQGIQKTHFMHECVLGNRRRICRTTPWSLGQQALCKPL